MIKISKTKLKNVLLIEPEKYEDFRGLNMEIYNEDIYKKAGIKKFVQDNISVSGRHVLRGIHGDEETWKLVTCLYGRIYFVVVNCDESSKEFGKWGSFILSDDNRHQVLVPPKFGNAHLVLSEQAIFHYRWSHYYNPTNQFTYRWNDEKFSIWWPIKNPVLSERDERGHYV